MKHKINFFSKLIFIFFSLKFLIFSELFSQELVYAKGIVTTPSGAQIKVEIADTLWKRRLGLSNRTELKKNWGMLFVFEKLKQHSFWMKDMNFPLDIIWLENHRIVDINENVKPIKVGQDPSILKPLVPVNFVLEIPAGRVSELQLKKGDFLGYRFF